MCTQIRTEFFSVGPDLGSNCLKKLLADTHWVKFLKFGSHIKKIKLGKKGKYTIFKQLRPKDPKLVLLKDTTQWQRWGSNPRPTGLESSTLPLSHCERIYKNRTCVYCYTQEATAACVMLTIWNHISISINKLLEIHSRPLSKWSLIILYELIFFGNLTYRLRLFPRVLWRRQYFVKTDVKMAL